MSSRASDSGAESSGSESPPPPAAAHAVGPSASRSTPSPSTASSTSSAAATAAAVAAAAAASSGIFRLSPGNAELVYSNLAAMVNSTGATGPQQQAAVLFRLGQLGRQLQASGQQPFILPMPNPPAAHQTPADLSSKSSRIKSEILDP